MSTPLELDPCDGASGRARCTWRQLQRASGEVRVIEGDTGGPLLVERRSMDRVQTWRRWMTDEKGRTWLELIEEKTADTKQPTAPQTPVEPRQERTP